MRRRDIPFSTFYSGKGNCDVFYYDVWRIPIPDRVQRLLLGTCLMVLTATFPTLFHSLRNRPREYARDAV